MEFRRSEVCARRWKKCCMAPPARLSLVIAEYKEGLYIGLIKNFPAGLAKRRRQNSFKTIMNNIHVHIGANLSRASEQ